MPVYNKLVRDKIPSIINKSGKLAQICILSDAEYQDALSEKLNEEIEELIEAQTREERLEEADDVLTVLEAFLCHYGLTMQEVEQVKVNKEVSHGGFSQRIFLEEVK
ncbi:Predicted house-cleaning noncanonical NTP pyrophosphatase, all-alpha NTP-PPase (MazG) superfamily [Amphibacillus marinus]|uniref:Predicted house-cleaning noncanonical NTP pyrophosphatase, all-alpha NTP-PPase (MazG) superfamily n=2 Tax=Amphibacillus marinus TaxID=872970 RepID=A0A1H8M4T0_9BACI|nr:Predicted house-cleaning noncanonical NTP pyrophosphatase, all-alpha NTP-PPase (MazG) superfamily [Amphibacillus marinus]